MSKRYQGNIISDAPVAPTANYETSSASGVWSLGEAEAYTRGGLWPTSGNLPPTAFFNTGSSNSDLEKVLIGTLGNASDFGNMGLQKARSGIASSTRGIFTTGTASNQYSNVIEYFTISAGGTLADFGDLTVARKLGFGVASSTRGVSAGANSENAGTGQAENSNVMDYVTIASTGNATDFGDLDAATTFGATSQNITRGCYMGGEISASPYNVSTVQYMTIASTGNTADWGDLKNNMQYQGGASDNHGGLQSS